MELEKPFKKIFDLMFRDKSGHVVVWQFPNVPIIGWFIFIILSKVVQSDDLRSGFTQISKAWLFTWAYLELFQGVNYFRRLLGLIFLALTIISIF